MEFLHGIQNRVEGCRTGKKISTVSLVGIIAEDLFGEMVRDGEGSGFSFPRWKIYSRYGTSIRVTYPSDNSV